MVAQDKKSVQYHWKYGEAVLFDDTYLHEAVNDSDETRVVLFIDVARNMPWYLHYWNKFSIWIAFQENSLREMRKLAAFKTRKERSHLAKLKQAKTKL